MPHCSISRTATTRSSSAGAFARTLAEHRGRGTRPGLFWSHDPAEPIGIWESIEEDDKGLKVRGRLVLETVRGREAHALLRAGALDGLSIGFRARQQERGPKGLRTLTEIDLVEISLVSLPAAAKARVVAFGMRPLRLASRHSQQRPAAPHRPYE